MATAVATQTETLVVRPKEKHKTTLHDLSEELVGLVIERVIRPSDLKNVCLVSKQWHELAVRSLYRNVALDLGSDNDNRLSSFLNPRNIGLKHIRQLRLYLAEATDRCNQERQAQFATRMILEFLPEDVLEEFSWCPWKAFSAETLLLLYKRQRKMRWLEVMDLDRDVLPDLKKAVKTTGTMFQNTRKLALYPENRDTLNLSGFFLEKCKDKVEELIVHCNFSDLGGSNVPNSRELNDSATEPGLLSRTIFASMMPFEKCEPLKNLTSLRLHRISMRHCAETWCKFINFHQLQHLRLYHCAGADTLLGQLSKSTNLPKTLKVLELQHRDNSDNEALLALDGFLCLVSGLRDMVIDLENTKALPAAAGIVRHGKTLELLSVHCSGTDSHSSTSMTSDAEAEELVWDAEDFEKISKACKDLEQLSCAWPSTSLIRSPSSEWKHYETCVLELKNMVTLHITTWPNNKPSTQLLPRVVYESLLRTLAQRMFEMAVDGKKSSSISGADSSDEEDNAAEEAVTHASHDTERPSKLRLVAFGTSEKIYEREDSKNQIIYLNSTAIDAEGRTVPHAVTLGWCLRQYVEPRSEVLDFVLHNYHPPISDYHAGTGRRHPPAGWDDEDDI